MNNCKCRWSQSERTPTWSEGDVEPLWLDLSGVHRGSCGLVAQRPVLLHLESAGGELQGRVRAAGRQQVTLQVTAWHAGHPLAKLLRDHSRKRWLFTFTFSRHSYPERFTVCTGTFSPRQVGWSALPKDTNFAQPGIEPATFSLLAQFPNRSATWLPYDCLWVGQGEVEIKKAKSGANLSSHFWRG